MHLGKSTKLKGNVALTTVILSGAILIAAGVAVVYNAIDVTLSTKAYVSRQISEATINSCIEDSLIRLTRNSSFLGQFTVPVNNGSCSATIAVHETDPNKRRVVVISTVNGYTVRRDKVIDLSTSPYTLAN